MTRALPTSSQLAEWLDGLAALNRKVGKGEKKRAAVDVFVQRVRTAYDRDRTGSSIPDGYPRGSGFGGFGVGMQFKVDADRWEGESSIELTSVELAIEHRIFSQKSVKDHHHDLTAQLISEVQSAVGALDRAQSLLARIDNLIDTNPNASNAVEGCRSHARLTDGLNRSYFQPAAREDGGRDGLCRWCYGWTLEHEDQLPPVELLDRLVRQGRITSKDIDEIEAARKRAS